MINNYHIKSFSEWEGLIRTLTNTRQTMEDVAEKMKKTVMDSLLVGGMTGDLVPILVQKYEEDVLAPVRIFQAKVDAFLKANEKVVGDGYDVHAEMTAKANELPTEMKPVYTTSVTIDEDMREVM